MMKHSLNFTILVLMVLILLTGVSFAVETGDVQKVVGADNQFSFDTYKQLSSSPGNLFFSPYSIYTALGLTYAGARGNTEQVMAKTLHVPFKGKLFHQATGELGDSLNVRGKKGNYTLHVANSVWLPEGKKVTPDFTATAKRYYDALIRNLNFSANPESARTAINTWVEENTGGKIKNLIPSGTLGKDTEFVLVNAIYFLGNWEAPFDEKNTKEASFSVTAARKVNVPMMYQRAHFRYAETSDLQILELPYKGRDLSMIILLPKAVTGVASVEKKFNRNSLGTWLKNLENRDVRTYIPRFRMSSGFNLSEILKKMGLGNAFSLQANFSGIGPKIMLSDVFHKAYVDVNEKGTEAAAATGVVGATMNGHPPVDFRADHPFIFVIRDRVTGTILFMGRMADPSKAE